LSVFTFSAYHVFTPESDTDGFPLFPYRGLELVDKLKAYAEAHPPTEKESEDLS